MYMYIILCCICIISYTSFFSSKVTIGKQANTKDTNRHLPAQSQQWKHQRRHQRTVITDFEQLNATWVYNKEYILKNSKVHQKKEN